MSYVLEGLKPAGFFKWFEEITRIPHGSEREEALSAFLENFAKERDLACVRDEIGNVLIRLPASAGYENEPPILLQGHMDMVWAKDSTATIDLAKDPLELVVDGNKLKAKGTTLGADDGSAIAAMLAIADDAAVAHPELELLCTVQEETALVGISEMDLSLVKSRRMINLDAGNSHEICVSAVGGRQIAFEKRFDRGVREGTAQLRLHLFGGLGGHAGILSHKNRACCINIMGELLHVLGREMPVYLAEITAPGPSIHGSCDAHVAVPADCAAQAELIVRKQFGEIYKRYSRSDPALAFEVLKADEDKLLLSAEDSGNIIRAMFFLHTGVRKSDEEDLSIIITSVTFSRISLKDGECSGLCVIRSLDDSVRDLWDQRVEELLRMLGFEPYILHEYTAWPGGGSAVMEKRFSKEHIRLFGEDIKRLHLHASVEANILMGRIPDMDAVAFQPTAVDFHTPDETLFIDQVQPFWDLLHAVLACKDS